MNLPALRQALQLLRTRLALLIGRGTVRAVNDAGDVQLLQLEVLQGELRAGVPHVQPYGFKSVPLPGAKAALLFPASAREDGVAVVVAHAAHRPTGWAPGECGLFTDEGTVLRAKRGQVLELTQVELRITVDSLSINAGGSLLEMDAAGLRITAPAVDIDP